MKKKSLAFNLLTFAVLIIGAYAGFLTLPAQAWLGIVAFVATVVLNQWFPSGQLIQGWNTVTWIVNIAGVLIQGITAIGDQGLLDPVIVNSVIMGINILIQTFLKE